MKTPKEILLQRHQAMEPKLNDARRNALAALTRPGLAQTWREFVFSIRWHLAGLSAVWLAVLLLNLDYAPAPTTVIARDKIPSAQTLWAALAQNRRALMELTETPGASETPAPPPRRGEIRRAIAFA
jgi:hypothetical protein